MKHLFFFATATFASVVISATALAAGTGSAADCQNLVGNYVGTVASIEGLTEDSEQITLSIDQVNENTLSILIMGEGEPIIVDGQNHKAPKGDSIYNASCSVQDGLTMNNFFQGENVGTLRITKTNDGIQYSMTKRDQTVIVNATKI